MKNINLNQLRIVIREAMAGEVEEQPGEEAAPAGPDAGALDTAGGGEEKSDVKTALQYIQKVNNRGEYAQMLTSIIQHGGSIPGSKVVLTKLYRALPGMIKGMQESKLNEDDVQIQPGGNWTQPGMEPDAGEPEPMPEEDMEAIATQVIEILRDLEHNDAVDVLTFAAQALGLAPPEEEKPPIGFRENLRQALIKESFKRTLKNATKK